MSLQPVESYHVPEETARVARAVFPKANLAMCIRDELGVLFHDRDFAEVASPLWANPPKPRPGSPS